MKDICVSIWQLALINHNFLFVTKREGKMLATFITNKGLTALINKELLEYDFKRLKTSGKMGKG